MEIKDCKINTYGSSDMDQSVYYPAGCCSCSCSCSCSCTSASVTEEE